ncbi:hypothetical protein FKM82_026804 [Ascaphus truei]
MAIQHRWVLGGHFNPGSPHDGRVQPGNRHVSLPPQRYQGRLQIQIVKVAPVHGVFRGEEGLPVSFRDPQGGQDWAGPLASARLLVPVGDLRGVERAGPSTGLVRVGAPRRVQVRGGHPPSLQHAVHKHVGVARVHLPESPLPRLILAPGNLQEAFVQREVVSDGIL